MSILFRELSQISTKLIPHFAKGAEPHVIRALDDGRIVEAVMQAHGFPEEPGQLSIALSQTVST
jgi:hypothetical protein